ncbi:hypothetical protein FCULG_00010596 [Fusarium culmorum]|uniref:F-box domain-containing protein n=1 Tax=Fusarium culmorum TaxID=5516 RepID=A0A2T4GCJ6_FUSCU|nr:hypothetical protein FCULG_00010596 [Fusarium culmorum]
MSRLLELPNELLRDIVLFASYDGYGHSCLKSLTLTNKRLREFAFPLLARHWDNFICATMFERLVLHLFTCPQHRSQIRSMQFTNHFWYADPMYRVSLHDEILKELAKEAKRTLPHLAESNEDWIDRIRQGSIDAIMVLVLAWATNLTKVLLWFREICMSDDKDMLSRCLSSHTRLKYIYIDLEYFLPLPKNVDSFAPDSLVSLLPASLTRLHITWQARYDMHNRPDPPLPRRYDESQTCSRITEAIRMLLQEAGPERKFSKLQRVHMVYVDWDREEFDKTVKLGKSRGVSVTESISFW